MQDNFSRLSSESPPDHFNTKLEDFFASQYTFEKRFNEKTLDPQNDCYDFHDFAENKNYEYTTIHFESGNNNCDTVHSAPDNQDSDFSNNTEFLAVSENP